MSRQLITCHGCGAVNNVPEGKSGQPVCGRCGMDLPVPDIPKIKSSVSGKRMLGFLIAGIVGIGIFTYAGVWDSPLVERPEVSASQDIPENPPKRPPKLVLQPVDAEPVFAEPPVSISTGVILPLQSPGLAPLLVKASPDAHHYVKLYSPDGEELMSMFIEAGESFEVDVPLGTYDLKLAFGDVWYGTEHLFGPDTGYEKLTDPLVFGVSDGYYDGHKIYFQKIRGGNLDTETISADEF